jgi:spore coat polysaccharide biosynthesis protein SpsF
MNVGAIIFSRMASQRLPGKALIEIYGRPLLGRVIDRSKMINNINHVIVATSTNPEDDEIVEFANSEGVDVFRGDSDDVAGRALSACDFFELDKFARICGDRPFFDPDLISSLINIHNDLNVDVVTTTHPRTYPPGLTGEVVSTQALRDAISMMNTSEDKEHVTSFFYRNPLNFSIKNIDSPHDMDFSGLNLCVDNTLDLSRAEWMASHLDSINNGHVDIRDIVSYAKEWYRLTKNNN